jgi:hypothetical protein
MANTPDFDQFAKFLRSCKTCGVVHTPRSIPNEPDRVTWLDPYDSHVYEPRMTLGTVDRLTELHELFLAPSW